jgi:hypothetical protein
MSMPHVLLRPVLCMLLLVASGTAMAQRAEFVDTPFGKVPKECHLQHPKGTTLSLIPNGLRATHSDGTVKDYASSTKCLEFAKTLKSRRRSATASLPSGSSPIVDGWFNYASWLAPATIGKFTATYTLPAPPANPGKQTVFYYIGLEDLQASSPTILQPVMTYYENAWSLVAWNCCPSGVANQSTPIFNMQTGDTISAEILMSQASPVTYTVSGNWMGNVTSLSDQTGSPSYNWPNVTLEIQNLNTCDQFMTGPFTFSQLVVSDTNMIPLTPQWGLYPSSGATTCNGNLVVNTGSSTITIQENISQ